MSRQLELFETGAQRDSRVGKGRFDLISPFLEERLAKVLEYGATHYGDNNWMKGFPFSRMLDSAKRHLNRWVQRQPDEDHDDNLAAAVFNIMALMTYEELIRRGKLDPKLDDRPDFGGVRHFEEGMRVTTTDLPFTEGCDPRTLAPEQPPLKCKRKPTPNELCELYVGDITRFGETRDAVLQLLRNVHDVGADPAGVERVYVAGPFRADSPLQIARNIVAAEDVGRLIAARGHYVHVPHAATWFLDRDKPIEYFMELDLGLIERWATAVYRMGGASAGADLEVQLARKLGLKVWTSLDEVPNVED